MAKELLWHETPEGKTGAVNYAAQRLGLQEYEVKSRRVALAELEPIARELGLTGAGGVPGAAELGQWFREFGPGGAFLGEHAPAREDGEESAGERAADEIDKGALESLLLNEAERLRAGERAELLEQLETGGVLSARQRQWMTVLLRGSDAKGGAEILREFLEFLFPRGVETVWTERRMTVSLAKGERCRQVALGWRLPQKSKGGGSAVVVESDAGVQRVYLFARFPKRKEEGGRRHWRAVRVNQYYPAEVFASQAVGMRLAVLWTFMHGGEGPDWNMLFAKPGEEKVSRDGAQGQGVRQLISYHRRKLADWLGLKGSGARALGGKAGDAGGRKSLRRAALEI